MRRSPALEELSRDHHHALVIARELVRATPENAARAASRFVEFLAHHELEHFAVEEEVLLPALPDEDPGPEFARRTRDDHTFLREAMRRLAGGDRAPDGEFLHTVGQRLRAHVQMEERELFPYLEELLSEAALEQLGARLRAFHARES
jgi:hemerythrin-like domain-containing protein